MARLVSRHGEDADILSLLVVPPKPAGGAAGAAAAKKTKAKKSGVNQSQKKQGKVKNCLKCRKSFWSGGPHNWICAPCKRSDDWD